MSILDQARAAIDQALEKGGRVILALEGGAASGKTTLATALGEMYHGSVIHMDEFFLPPALRTPDRFTQPGGNIHSERFQILSGGRYRLPMKYSIAASAQLRVKRKLGMND